MTDNSIMPFGKYKGEKLANVPADYLLYMYHLGKLYGELKKYIENNMDVLKIEADRENKQKEK